LSIKAEKGKRNAGIAGGVSRSMKKEMGTVF